MTSVSRCFDPRRVLSCTRREALELRRDPIRGTLAVLGTAILMFVMGFGINMDVKDLTFAVLDRDDSTISRDYVLQIAGAATLEISARTAIEKEREAAKAAWMPRLWTARYRQQDRIAA